MLPYVETLRTRRRRFLPSPQGRGFRAVELDEELLALYVRQHKTIFEIGRILGIEAGSVYWRLQNSNTRE